jgi:hypothetical protein
MMQIRLERKSDHRAVENLVRESFWNVYKPGCDEHLVLHQLRIDPSFVPELDYVVESEEGIIAQIVYAKGTLIDSQGQKTEVLMFGPVSVHPDCQGQGIGAALIEFTLKKAKGMGYPAVLITGHPDYYKRFGFSPATRHGVYLENIDPNEEAPFFMIKILDGKKAKTLNGVFHLPVCYLTNDADLEAFDSAFPIKEKLKLPGQLW